MPTNNIINKIQKLLSLANSDNENEAKAAMNMANTLLLKHNLSIQQIEGLRSEYQFKNVGKESLTLKLHQKLITNLLRDYFFVEILILKKNINSFNRAKYQKTIQLVGTKENCEIASYIFAYLDNAYPELWKTYTKNNPDIQYYKASYYRGLTMGIKNMLESTRWKVQEEMGLILKEDVNLTKFIKQKSTGTYGNQSSNIRIDQKVYNDGINDGINITLRKPVRSEYAEKSEVWLLMG